MSTLREELRTQMVFELESAYIYLGMAAWLKNNNWNGFSTFMTEQAHEEYDHTMRFYDYLMDIGEEVYFDQLNAPKKDYKSVAEVFEEALKHEKVVTSNIHSLYKRAKEENDFATQKFLDWFITEQVEEEATFDEITHVLKNIKDSYTGLYLYDKELGQRGETQTSQPATDTVAE